MQNKELGATLEPDSITKELLKSHHYFDVTFVIPSVLP